MSPARPSARRATKKKSAAKPVRPRRTVPAAPPPSPAAVAKQVAGFIAKFEPPIQKLIRSTRVAMRKRLPTAIELVYDNYNFFVIGYGPNERATEAILSIAAYAKGVGISFIHGATLPDPSRLLLGEGKQNRYLRLGAATDLDKPAVEALIRAAVRQSKVPMPKVGGHTVIKSISAKQRPRREAS